jgi:hypothetical protein
MTSCWHRQQQLGDLHVPATIQVSPPNTASPLPFATSDSLDPTISSHHTPSRHCSTPRRHGREFKLLGDEHCHLRLASLGFPSAASLEAYIPSHASLVTHHGRADDNNSQIGIPSSYFHPTQRRTLHGERCNDKNSTSQTEPTSLPSISSPRVRSLAHGY